MSIVDDLVANLVERNALRVSGSLTVRFVDGGASISGALVSTLHDQAKNKDLLTLNAPVNATVRIGELIVPLPKLP